VQINTFLGLEVFEKKRFKVIVDANVYVYDRP
jgi:hypothetical protein